MRAKFLLLSILGGLLLLGGHSWSQDKDEVRALLDKAIKAHGGAANLKKWNAVSFKGTGKLFKKDKVIGYQTIEIRQEGTDLYYSNWKAGEFGGKDVQTVVLIGSQGWIKQDDKDTRPLEKNEAKFVEEDRYIDSVTKLLSLTNEQFILLELAETKVEEQTALGIQVKRKGRPDVALYFDKTKYLLIKSAVTRKWEGKATKWEMFYSNFKNVEGTKLAHKITIHKDRELFSEWTLESVRVGEVFVREKAFARP